MVAWPNSWLKALGQPSSYMQRYLESKGKAEIVLFRLILTRKSIREHTIVLMLDIKLISECVFIYPQITLLSPFLTFFLWKTLLISTFHATLINMSRNHCYDIRPSTFKTTYGRIPDPFLNFITIRVKLSGILIKILSNWHYWLQ